MKRTYLLLGIWATTTYAYGIDCSALAPIKPQDMTVELKGKVDGKIGGAFSKIASANASVDGSYKEISKYVLKDFPNSNVIYMWERVLYLQCQAIEESKDLPSREKIKAIGDLYQKFGTPPPPIGPTASIINSGDNSTIVQGNNNTVKKGN